MTEAKKKTTRTKQVKCKDCRYWDTQPASMASPERWCLGWHGRIATTAESYCSRAEKKDA